MSRPRTSPPRPKARQIRRVDQIFIILPALKHYLCRLEASPIERLVARPAGSAPQGGKAYGYGIPLFVEYRTRGRKHRVILHTQRPDHFGHEHMADRAAEFLWSHAAFNQLPKHVPSFDVGMLDPQGKPVSLGQAREFFLLTGYVEGKEYGHDLRRIGRSDSLRRIDFQRADALCDYLLSIHKVNGDPPQLYTRRIRELVGHGECIMGLTDSYPRNHPWITPRRLRRIEELAVSWRWRLKDRVHRLRQVHGDFHPWNILFRKGTDFSLLDRSRGQWGEPADDLVALTVNYIFESLQAHGRFWGGLQTLFERFWERYLALSGDEELPSVVAPFIAFRGLVLASPVWYPTVEDQVRRQLFAMIEAVLKEKQFDPTRVNRYIAGQ